ncbi:MAG: hypothetical protein LAO31_02925 [Acidobacteriia bacterium]|nr:hypothetical protein [Terriglobia bacterium]
MKSSALLIGVFSAWAGVTAFWIALMIYRGVIGMREEDQVFLHKGEESLVRAQKEVAEKLKRVSPYLLWSGILSAALLILFGVLWFYRGWNAM